MIDTTSVSLISKALDGLALRHLYTAQNIANANTPDYKPVTVRFEDSLRMAADHGLTAISDVQPSVVAAPGSEVSSEMRLDLELATASQTALRYSALIDVLGRQMALSRAVVEAGR